MLFNSPQFLFVFLPVCLAVFWLLGAYASTTMARLWMLAASLVFYGWFEWRYLLLIGGSILVNYGFGLLLARLRAESRERAAKAALTAGIGVNVAALAWFKYTNFLLGSVAFTFGFDAPVFNIVLPLAISFFTFQQIAYLVDAYYGQVAEHDLLDYALFVCFFPQLIAGPIVHHAELMPQFRRAQTYRIDFSTIDLGLVLVLLGLFKKVVLADGVAPLSNQVFGAADAGEAVTLVESWAGALAFALQIYFDFSGYSDMAIGLALMVGIRLPENFRAPYRAASIIDFWRRWHMTLSRFLRDYVYIPLGGNRQGRVRRYVNLLATMLIGGLWHGASWTFVIWGALHGLYLVVNHLWHWLAGSVLGIKRLFPLGGIGGWALTFLAVLVAWVFFRAQTFAGAASVLEGMLGRHGVALPPGTEGFLAVPAAWLAAAPATPLFTEQYVYELAGILLLMAVGLAVALLGRPVLYLGPNLRRLLLVPTTAFSLKAVVFGGATMDFIYFQF